MEGSKEITFSISKKSILYKIGINSYYRGERLKDDMGAVAARMQSGVDNDDVLSDELDIAVTHVVAIVSRNLGRCTVEEKDEAEEKKINFKVVGASLFPDDLIPVVEKAIATFLFDKTLEGWVLINMPSDVQSLGNRSESDAERLRQLLIERQKPIL